MAKEHVKTFIAGVGLTEVAKIIPGPALRHARTAGYFSARRYRCLKELGDAKGVECPLDMFSWAKCAVDCGVCDKQFGTKGGIVQEAETK